MFGPVTTAGLIDAFESRFTSANGAHFLIAPNGKEAWPLSEAENQELRALYRRRMQRARWIRRAALIAFIPLTIAIGSNMPEGPRWLRNTFQTMQLLTLFVLPFIAFTQHRITSTLTKAGIARRLKQRITTRFELAVTPVATPLGRSAKRLLIAAGLIEVAIMLGHAIGPREELAAHLRVFYGLTSGNESLLARFTGILSFMLQLTILASAALLVYDRRQRQRAAAANAAAVPDGHAHRAAPPA